MNTNEANIAVLCSSRQAFLNWHKEFVIDGGGSEFMYVDVENVSKAKKRDKFDGIVLLPCVYELDPRDVEDGVAFIRKHRLRATPE